jgi:hypothetical protein
MKKRFSIGMIALLSVSLFFSSCPADGGSSLIAKTKSLATDLGPHAWASRTTIVLTEDIMLDKNFTLPADISLSIPAGKTFIADFGRTFTVEKGGSVTIAGNLILESGSKDTIDGTVTVKSGGSFTNNGGNPITGLIVVEAGGKYASSAFSIGNSTALLSLTNGKLFFNSSSLILDGEAELTKNSLIDTVSGSLTLKRNSTFTIAASITLTIKNSTAILHAIVGEDGGNESRIIVFGNFNFLDVSNTDINFYDNNGTALTLNSNGNGKIYQWNANANGRGNPGWKATS